MKANIRKNIAIMLVLAILMLGANINVFATQKVDSARDSTSDQIAYTTAKQKDILRAYGLTEKQITTTTYRQISELLKNGEITHPEYLEKYYDREAMRQDAINMEKLEIEHLKSLGYTDAEITAIRNIKDLYPMNIQKSDEKQIKSLITSYQNNALKRLTPVIQRTGDILFFYDTSINDLLSDNNNLGFHINAFSQGNTPPYNESLLYDEAEMWKMNARNYASNLYGTSVGVTYWNYLFAEYAVIDGSPQVHRGIDTNKGIGNNIYSITSGVVSAKTSTYISIWYSSYQITLSYFHLTPSSSLSVGSTVSKWTILGTENWNGLDDDDDAHTHIEIRENNSPGGQTANIYFPTSPVLSPYDYLRYFC